MLESPKPREVQAGHRQDGLIARAPSRDRGGRAAPWSPVDAQASALDRLLGHAVLQRAGRDRHVPGDEATGRSALAAVQSLSGLDLSDVRVHRNSPEPALLDAQAFASGRDIHLGPGADRHLAHEAWHVVQQARGVVRPTRYRGARAINDDPALERDAEAMARRAAVAGPDGTARALDVLPRAGHDVAQLLRKPRKEERAELDQMLVDINRLLATARSIVRDRTQADRLDGLLVQINTAGNAAITKAIEIFDIDVSAASAIESRVGKSGPFISLASTTGKLGSGAFGTTDAEGVVLIGPSAYQSAAVLGSTIGHEATVHAKKHTGKNWTIDKRRSALQEVEAHSWEVEHAEIFGSTEEEIAEAKRQAERYRKEAEEKDATSGGSKSGRGCFMTTACTVARGLPDDCAELTTLRAFRDEYVARQPNGRELIDHYYAIAPTIVERITQRVDAAAVLDDIHDEVAACVRLVRDGSHDAALGRYRQMVHALEREA